MKNSFAIFLSLIIVFCGFIPPAYAESKIKVFLHGNEIKFEQQPVIENGYVFVPAKTLLEALGYNIEYMEIAREAIAYNGITDSIMYIDSNELWIDENEYTMPISAKTINGKLFVPLKPISEILNMNVFWDKKTNIIKLESAVTITYERRNADTGAAGITPPGAPNSKPVKVDSGNYILGGIEYNITPEFYPQAKPNTDSNAYLQKWMLGANAVNNTRYRWYMPDLNITLSQYWKDALKNDLAEGEFYIENKRDLIAVIDWISNDGDNVDFNFYAYYLDDLSYLEYKEFLTYVDPADRYIFGLIKNLSSKWGDKGITAWDCFRASLLVQWGFEAGYLSKEEAYAYMKPVSERLKKTFNNWEEACENYIDGYCYWSLTDPSVPDTEYRVMINVYNAIKDNKEIFDNSLFW